MVADFDPVALTIGPLVVRWYGLAYMVGFVGAWWWAKFLVRRFEPSGIGGVSPGMIDDFMNYAIIGVILGGRLGEVIFYNPGYYLAHPLEILFIWQGGMSFHGGVLGVVLALWLFSHRRGIAPLFLADLVCAGVCIGLFFGRLANFVNGELWGRVTDVSWAVIFPRSGDDLLRHPSPVYEAILEGLVLFLFLQWLIFRHRALDRPGVVAGAFLLGYAVARIIAELFREPDTHIGLLSFGSTWGQWLSLPMFLLGVWLIVRAGKKTH